MKDILLKAYRDSLPNLIPKQEITDELKLNLELQGYRFMREVENRGLCGLLFMVFTVGLMYGIDENTYVGRYCFPDLREAIDALRDWDGRNDPPGNWIKHKGYIEYENPAYKKIQE